MFTWPRLENFRSKTSTEDYVRFLCFLPSHSGREAGSVSPTTHGGNLDYFYVIQCYFYFILFYLLISMSFNIIYISHYMCIFIIFIILVDLNQVLSWSNLKDFGLLVYGNCVTTFTCKVDSCSSLKKIRGQCYYRQTNLQVQYVPLYTHKDIYMIDVQCETLSYSLRYICSMSYTHLSDRATFHEANMLPKFMKIQMLLTSNYIIIIIKSLYMYYQGKNHHIVKFI